MTTHAPGEMFDDRYRLTKVLGKGAHGVVYAAEDTLLGSRVAIKCLSPKLAEDGDFKVRMHREARAMGALSGTSATQIFAFAKAPDGTLYIVMEHLSGRDLEAYLREVTGHGGKVDLGRVISLLGPIAETLAQAHDLGLVHRDVKPGNIFVLDTMTRGGVRLLDFGLAKDLNATALTQEGMIAGSPGYIAPEIWRGRAREADRRIDVYSLGVVVYRALAGQVPFDPKQPMDQFLIQVTRGPRPSLCAVRKDLPRAIDGWVEKALAANPDDRFGSISAMWNVLRSIAELPAETRSEPPSIPWVVEIDDEIEVEVMSLRSAQLGPK